MSFQFLSDQGFQNYEIAFTKMALQRKYIVRILNKFFIKYKYKPPFFSRSVTFSNIAKNTLCL